MVEKLTGRPVVFQQSWGEGQTSENSPWKPWKPKEHEEKLQVTDGKGNPLTYMQENP